MDKKLRETSNLYVGIMNSKRQVKGETLGTNSRLPFDVNVMLSQQRTTLLDGTYCVRLLTLLHLVACCWEFLRSLKSVKLLATWKPNIVGQQLLGVVGLRLFGRSFTNARRMPGKGSGLGTLGLISFKRIIRFFEILHSRSPSTLLSQAYPWWEVKNTITSGVLRTNFYQEIRLKLGIMKDKVDSRCNYFLLLLRSL